MFILSHPFSYWYILVSYMFVFSNQPFLFFKLLCMKRKVFAELEPVQIKMCYMYLPLWPRAL